MKNDTIYLNRIFIKTIHCNTPQFTLQYIMDIQISVQKNNNHK